MPTRVKERGIKMTKEKNEVYKEGGFIIYRTPKKKKILKK